jgi:4-amino-4-deoxy-L-arabinose transferase-like glycosyltransferase/PII-like signaling protein
VINVRGTRKFVPLADQGGRKVRLPVQTIGKGEGVAVFALLLGLVMTLQTLAGAYASGFGAYPDEPAHLVTALMVRDFLASLDFRHAWQFAQQYYLHYPKVAIGVWPPVFYGALGSWLLMAGASRGTAILFIAIVAATTASVTYFVGKRLIGRWAGVLAAVLFVASPLVQESSARVMSEHLVTLAMLVSTLCFARLARTERISDGLAFGTIAALAILTHGNAWALGLVPGITLALTNRWYLLRRPGLWLSAVPVLVTCVPWYVLAPSIVAGRGGGVFSLIVEAVPGYVSYLYLGVGLPVLIFALFGVWSTIVRVTPRTEVAPEWAALAGLAIATLILHSVLPVPVDSRYIVLLIPSVVLFSAAGANEIAHRLGAHLPISVLRVGLAVTLITAFSMGSFALPLQLRNGGYEALVRDVMARVSNVPQVWLISSGSTGEGCLVAAVALQEARPSSYVLRGKTILAGGDWFWGSTRDRFDTPAKLAQLLDDLPVTIIVIDDRVPSEQRRPYHDRLQELVTSESDRWEPIGSYPQMQDGIEFANSLRVYARRPVASLAIDPPAIQLDRLKALMVRKELR